MNGSVIQQQFHINLKSLTLQLTHTSNSIQSKSEHKELQTIARESSTQNDHIVLKREEDKEETKKNVGIVQKKGVTKKGEQKKMKQCLLYLFG